MWQRYADRGMLCRVSGYKSLIVLSVLDYFLTWVCNRRQFAIRGSVAALADVVSANYWAVYRTQRTIRLFSHEPLQSIPLSAMLSAFLHTCKREGVFRSLYMQMPERVFGQSHGRRNSRSAKNQQKSQEPVEKAKNQQKTAVGWEAHAEKAGCFLVFYSKTSNLRTRCPQKVPLSKGMRIGTGYGSSQQSSQNT